MDSITEVDTELWLNIDDDQIIFQGEISWLTLFFSNLKFGTFIFPIWHGCLEFPLWLRALNG